MKNEFPLIVEAGRIGRSAGWPDGETTRSGSFRIRYQEKNYFLNVIASDGGGWDHVSVSVHNQKRTPTWEEMKWVKELFFEPHETAMQLHPPQSNYVNVHEYVLHIWRPQRLDIPAPPRKFV